MSVMETWRIAGTIFGAVVLYGALHSVLASRTVKAWAAAHLHLQGGAYRLAFNVISTLTLLPVLALPVRYPDHLLYRLPLPWAALAVAVQLLGALLALDALRRTGLWAFLGFRDPERERSFTVAGPYRWMRHPVYAGSLLFLWASPLMTRNQALFYAALSLYLVVGELIEERRLTQELGTVYRDYRRRVPTWTPWLTLLGMTAAWALARGFPGG